MKKSVAKTMHEKLVANDVEWLSLDSFRVWHMRDMEDEGVLGVELGSDEFKIVHTHEE